MILHSITQEKSLNLRDVETLVQKPQIYILGRTSDKIIDQLCYVNYRVDDLIDLKNPILSSQNVQIRDSMRFFHGDHPAQAVETGQQDGGHYPCCLCAKKASSWGDLISCYRADIVTLQERIEMVNAGPAGKQNRNGIINPFKSLNGDKLKQECQARGLTTEELKRPELQAQLNEHLHGIQRVPALMMNNQRKTAVSLADMNLSNYEVIPTEPLHDIKEHIKNVMTELPHKLTSTEIVIMNSVKKAVVENKDKLRGSDYRFWEVTLALEMYGKARMTITKLLCTLAEICYLCYARSEKRSPKFILRFHNVAFVHSVTYLKLFDKPVELTLRKMYGVYWHSLSIHAPLVSRIISLRAVNTEEEERLFADINSISRSTSSGKPGHIIPNSIIRIQAEQHFKSSREDPFESQQSKISKFAEKLPDFQRTMIHGDLMTSELYQAHLERIADFLVLGEGI